MTDALPQTFLARALADGRAAIAGEGRNERIRYLAAGHSECWADPEEKVRAELWAELIYKYEYAPERIGFEVNVPRRTPNDYADLVIYSDDEKKMPYCVIECKRADLSDSAFAQAIEQACGNRASLGALYCGTVAGLTRRLLRFVAALLVVVATAACIGGDEPKAKDTTPTPDLRATIDAALAKIAADQAASVANNPTRALLATATPAPTPTDTATKAPTEQVAGVANSPTRTLPATATPVPTPTTILKPTPETSIPFDTLMNARYLESTNVQLAEIIRELPWIKDGIDLNEKEAVTQLIQLAAFNETIFQMMLHRNETTEPHTLDWVHDTITRAETEVLQQLGNIAHNNAAVAEQVIALPWVGDSVTEAEVAALQQLGGIAHNDPATAKQIIALPWVADDVTETEISAIGYIPYHSPAVTQQTIELPWIADGISESEIPAIRSITYHDATTVQQIIALPWVADGVSEAERLTIMGIPYHLKDVVNGENHPNQRYIGEKQYMLTLINQERTKAGVPTIKMGDNISAQLHAEDMLHNCYRAHKGLDGRQPLERFQDHGGETPNFGGENIIGFDECTPNAVRPKGIPKSDVAGAMDAWMNSTGHRVTLLTLSHCKVNIGIAWSGYNSSMVQLFESDGTYSNGPCSTRD